jgi:archaellin
MKKTYLTLYLVILLLFTSFSIVWSDKANDPFGKLDMVSVVVDQKAGSNKVVAKVNLVNDENITAIVVPLKYGTGKSPISLDSVSFTNTAVDKFALKSPNIDVKTQKVLLALISTISAADIYLPKGTNEIARLYFTLKKGAGEGSVTLDTTSFPPSNVLQLVKAQDKVAQSIYPGFDNTKGKISLLK